MNQNYHHNMLYKYYKFVFFPFLYFFNDTTTQKLIFLIIKKINLVINFQKARAKLRELDDPHSRATICRTLTVTHFKVTHSYNHAQFDTLQIVHHLILRNI